PGQGVKREPVKVPEGRRKTLDGFENIKHWRLGVLPKDAPAKLELVDNPKRQGAKALKMTYDFSTTSDTRACYANYRTTDGKPVNIGTPKAVSVWVFGDGNGHWLRGQFIDKNGAKIQIDFTEFVNWNHNWARCTALIPEGVHGPIVWDSIYLVQHRPEAKTAGYIFLDDFQGIY
ncbi:MAG: hypothetical protein HZB16_24565, partial [Armatimonadetes bacterium]|nr:hypothetical protein [Armatimonadota bacterium]